MMKGKERYILLGVAGVALGMALLSSVYVINEGNMGVKTRMGQAIQQEGPSGLRFKAPFIEGIVEFDVRERALPIQLVGATFDQMPTSMEISVNWQPDPTRAMEIYQKYGNMEAFAANTIAPRLRQSLKASVGQFTAARMIRERQAVADEMLAQAQAVLSAYPVILNSVQVENFDLPQRYMEAVLNTQQAAEAAKKAEQDLERQRFESRQTVQTAEANADAQKAVADAQAYATQTLAEADAEAIKLRGEAEADAIEAQAKALADNPLLVELRRVEAWDGTLPTMVMGSDQPELLMQIPQ